MKDINVRVEHVDGSGMESSYYRLKFGCEEDVDVFFGIFERSVDKMGSEYAKKRIRALIEAVRARMRVSDKGPEEGTYSFLSVVWMREFAELFACAVGMLGEFSEYHDKMESLFEKQSQVFVDFCELTDYYRAGECLFHNEEDKE